MADNEKTTLATFNVGSDDWESFKALAKKDGRPASYFLNRFIKESISRGSFENVCSDVKPISDIDLSGVESLVNESVKTAIADLTSQLSELRGEVETLKESEPVS